VRLRLDAQETYASPVGAARTTGEITSPHTPARVDPRRTASIMPASRLINWSSSAAAWFLWSMGNRRQFERFSHWCIGELIARDRTGRPDRRKVVIRSVSERGLGAHLLGDAAVPIARGTQVIVRLPGFGGLLEVPGRVVWSDRRGPAPAPLCVGIALFLEIVPSATRRLFTAWFADAAARRQEPPDPGPPPSHRAL
jgi:PilZ domain